MLRFSQAILLLLLLTLTSCTNIMHAVRDEPYQPDPSETSFGTDIDDFQMETHIGVNIKKASPQLESAHINVNAYNGVVLLTGETANESLRSLAGNTARAYRGVRLVHNELTIQGTSSFLSRANDTWLRTKLRTKIIANDQVRTTTVKIVVEGGSVFLMGILPRREADRAAQIASNTGGVNRVVKLFEYLD